MKIKETKIKDVFFEAHERVSVTQYVKLLIGNDYQLHEGHVIDGLVYGNPLPTEPEKEEISLISGAGPMYRNPFNSPTQ
jgi:hypothetical protein